MQNNFTLPLKCGSIYEEVTKNVMILSERADKGKCCAKRRADCAPRGTAADLCTQTTGYF